jgi:hypothetical protein
LKREYQNGGGTASWSLEFSGNKVNHRSVTFKGMESSRLALSRLNYRIYSFADGVGQTLFKKIQYLIFVPHQGLGRAFHRFKTAAAHP